MVSPITNSKEFLSKENIYAVHFESNSREIKDIVEIIARVFDF